MSCFNNAFEKTEIKLLRSAEMKVFYATYIRKLKIACCEEDARKSVAAIHRIGSFLFIYIALTITRFELNVRGSAPCFHVIACEYVKLLLWFSVVCTINRRATRPVVHSFILSVRLIRLIDEFLFIAICVHTLDSTRLNSTASTSFCSTGCT